MNILSHREGRHGYTVTQSHAQADSQACAALSELSPQVFMQRGSYGRQPGPTTAVSDYTSPL